MKKFITLAILITLSAASMATTIDYKNNSPVISALLKGLKKEDKHFVYGGADVSRRPTLVTHTTMV